MSFLSFAKAMLGDELKELGFERKSGVDWYKLIDDCIYLRLRFRRFSGYLEVTFGIQSLFSKLRDDDEILNFNLTSAFFQREMAAGKEDTFNDSLLWLTDENSDLGKLMLERGRDMFNIVKPALASVHDLQSCFEAINQVGYLRSYAAEGKRLGRTYTLEEHTTFPPEDSFFILCRLEQYDKAVQYLKQHLVNFGRIYSDALRYDIIMSNEKARMDPYIEMIELGEFDKINDLMLANYNDGCDRIEEKFKIKINREHIVFD